MFRVPSPILKLLFVGEGVFGDSTSVLNFLSDREKYIEFQALFRVFRDSVSWGGSVRELYNGRPCRPCLEFLCDGEGVFGDCIMEDDGSDWPWEIHTHSDSKVRPIKRLLYCILYYVIKTTSNCICVLKYLG